MVQKSVGQLLVERKLFTPVELENYMRASQENNQSLLEYLRVQKLIKDEDIARAYAEQFGVPFIAVITEKMADTELISQIPLKFLREHAVIPVFHEGALYIVTSDPTDFQPLDELTLLLGGDARPAVSTRGVIIDAINRYYPLEGTKQMIEELEEEQNIADGAVDFGTIDEEDILGMANEAPIIKLVNHILYQAVKRGASDIHIEPFEKEIRVRYRIDGVMYATFTPPKRAQAALVSRIKIMSNLNIAEKRVPQDGRIQIKIADKAIDIRVSVLPVAFGERIVMRLLDKTKTIAKLKNMGLSERDYNVINYSIAQPNGIVLLTGPTGSGKTSTLYALLAELNTTEVNIVTVEDPVEYQMQGISQVQVRDKVGLTFAAALRSILRQDPDIVMIGETRDQETAQIAIQASLTGHLVLSTLHTNNAAATITRLIDMGVEPFLIASTLTSVVAQRLVRRLCQVCKQPYTPEADVLRRIGITPEQAQNITFYKPYGCEECLNTGYRGRIAIFEVMVMSGRIASLTMERADTAVIQAEALKEGMTLLVQDGILKIKQGSTTIDEVLAVAASTEGVTA